MMLSLDHNHFDIESIVRHSWQKFRTRKVSLKSIWVIVGFIFWVGFFIGAIIMQAMIK